MSFTGHDFRLSPPKSNQFILTSKMWSEGRCPSKCSWYRAALKMCFKQQKSFVSPCRRKLLSASLLVKCYCTESAAVSGSTGSRALQWQSHSCAVQMQGFSIFLTAWQTHSNPQSLSLLILPDKGAHKARMGCSVPSIPGQYLSLRTQTCQLTSPGLMSLRALSWSRKLLSGKDASALGMQLWLPGHKRRQGEKGSIRSPHNRILSIGATVTWTPAALTWALKQKQSRALTV